MINKVHCLFEQSGTFKNAFKSFGIDAEDYDILNDFKETDNVVDLFSEIDKAYDENPATRPHYLTSYFPIKPKIIDKDRTKNGDFYKKPTQYWFLNLEPQENFCMIPIEYVKKKTIDQAKGINRQRDRSMIHPQYARRFIAQYILEVDGKVVTDD